MKTEAERIAERYARRTSGDRYSPLRPDVQQTLRERQRVLLALFECHGGTDLSALKLTEVGCGSGVNLLELLGLGFAPQHLTGIELLPDRHAAARRALPDEVTLRLGDATQTAIDDASQDLVLQSTVFSSLLDDAFQHALADAMWRWLRRGGAVIWYDMAIDNPRNADVRGVSEARIHQLFPHACFDIRRVTLAPPLARAACRVHPSLYTLFNLLPLLRTHRLAWIHKPP